MDCLRDPDTKVDGKINCVLQQHHLKGLFLGVKQPSTSAFKLIFQTPRVNWFHNCEIHC